MRWRGSDAGRKQHDIRRVGCTESRRQMRGESGVRRGGYGQWEFFMIVVFYFVQVNTGVRDQERGTYVKRKDMCRDG